MKRMSIFWFAALTLTLFIPSISAQTQTEPAASDAAPSQSESPKRVRVSQGVMQVMVVKRVQAKYPDEARQARIQGPVVMRAVIGKNGDVIELQLISGHPLLAPAAMSALRQWKYRPYMLNGAPIEVETTITYNFTLSGG